MIKTVILCISTTRTKENDISSKVIREILSDDKFDIIDYNIVKDDLSLIKKKLIYYADKGQADMILTTGGTGLGPMDVTPEATQQVIEKQIPGIPELIRMEGMKKTRRASLSRGTAGIRKNTLIINLPGGPKGAKESLEAVIDIILHAVDMMKGMGH